MVLFCLVIKWHLLLDECFSIWIQWSGPLFLNTIVASGIPHHVLTLKVSVPVMLLQNIDQSLGSCNGTRLIVSRLRKYVVEGIVISRSNVEHKVYIPILSFTPSDPRTPFKFQRRLFPLITSFSMIINKIQRQSLKHVRVHLPRPVFSHG